MRPQARFAINDSLTMREHQLQSTLPHQQTNSGAIDWRTVLDKARNAPDLYRLTAIIVHNTDDNPATTRVGIPFMSLASTGTAAHQLFAAEIQFRYGLYDELEGVEVLEAGSRALHHPLRALQRSQLEAIRPGTSPGNVPVGPPSPRAQF